MTTPRLKKPKPISFVTEADFRTHRRHNQRRFYWMMGGLAANFVLSLLIIFVR